MRKALGAEKKALDGSSVCVVTLPLICPDEISLERRWKSSSDSNLETFIELLINKSYPKYSSSIFVFWTVQGQSRPKAFSVLMKELRYSQKDATRVLMKGTFKFVGGYLPALIIFSIYVAQCYCLYIKEKGSQKFFGGQRIKTEKGGVVRWPIMQPDTRELSCC